jgi:hypothetical protein
MSITWNVPSLPFALSPSDEKAWTIGESRTAITATAAPHSDIFIDPSTAGSAGSGEALNAESMLNAATLLGIPPQGDFQFSARVSVEFASTYDAGALLVWFDERHWGKLCFEFSPQDEPMIVSVVARGVADDANAFVVSGRQVWLRVSRIDHAFAYHASLDGQVWRLIRFFAIEGPTTHAALGFEAQSPTGDGCCVTFDDLHFSSERLGELRDGS